MLKAFIRSIAAGFNRASDASAALLARSAAALKAGDLPGAIEFAEAALKRDPGCHEAWNLLGAVALRQGDEPAGCHHFDRAASLQEDNADYLSNAGEAYRRAGRYEAAVERLRAAIRLSPRNGAALHSLAMALAQQWRGEEAFHAYQEMLAAAPGFCQGHQGYLFFLNFHRTLDPGFILAEHRRWAAIHADSLAGAPPFMKSGRARRLTVGYASADFKEHAVAYFIEPVLRCHDRERFRVVLYSSALRNGGATAKFVALADLWRDISSTGDAEAAALVRKDGVDILVDLSGHSAGNRLLVFARKPAPVQITYLGYPSGTGMRAIDYRLTDPCADPGEGAQANYVERLLRLPNTLWCYGPPADMPEAGDPPAARNGYVTFGSLNHVLKITPALIALWAQILLAVPRARLVMAAIPQGEAQERIASEFARSGIEPQRLRILGRLQQQSFWDLHREIDVVLDSFPCNGGTTSCETLWIGVPLLSLAGEVFLSRAGLSMLSALGLRDMVARDGPELVAMAKALAGDVSRLAEHRRGLRERMLRSALTDARGFTRDLEVLYADALRERTARRGP